MDKRVLAAGFVLAIGAVTLTGVGVSCLSGQSSSIASDKKGKSELPVGTSVKGGDVPRLGKTPHAYQCTFGEDLVLYKDYPEDKKDSFSGLFLCRLDEGKEKLCEREMLTDSFYSSANIYNDHVVFISTDNAIEQISLKDKKSEVIYDADGKTICDALIIGDILYFIKENNEGGDDLLAIDLKEREEKELTKNISPHYLYHCRGNVKVISENNDSVIECNFQDGIKGKQAVPEDEIQGFMDNGDMILCHDHDEIYCLNGKNERKKLLEKENIYRTIMHNDELLICTVNEHGLIEVFIYCFEEETLVKVANADAVPADFNKKYVLCSSEEGSGLAEMLDRDTGEIIDLNYDSRISVSDGKIDVAPDEEDREDTRVEKKYKAALAEEDYHFLLKKMKRYYKKKGWDLIDYRVADDSHSEYENRKEYQPGNIIVLEVHTSYNTGIYRMISFGRKDSDSKWKLLNEGF